MAVCPIKDLMWRFLSQGKQQDVDAFIADIGNKPPKRAAILKLLEEPVGEPEKFNTV